MLIATANVPGMDNPPISWMFFDTTTKDFALKDVNIKVSFL